MNEFQWMGGEHYFWRRGRLERNPDHVQVDPEGDEWWLIDDHAREAGALYAPLGSGVALFDEFVGLEASREAVAVFANTYGRLTGVLTPAVLENGASGSAESLTVWLEELAAMRRAQALWQASQRGDGKYLRSVIKTTYSGDTLEKAVYRSGSEASEIVNSRRPSPLLARTREAQSHEDQLVVLAAAHLLGVVNSKIAKHARPAFLPDESAGGLALTVVPEDLRGALWWRFGCAVAGRVVFKDCSNCNRLFDVSEKGRRGDALYCSEACKSEAYRRRRALACVRWREGVLSEEEIARELSSPGRTIKAETVANWVKAEGAKTGPPRRRRG